MRAANLTVLTGDIQAEYGPGVTVWGKGDLAHRESISDHNEDDTPGSKSEQSDSDNIPEHRALDLPYEGPFSEADADDLRVKLITRPANQRRLRYVIQRQTIWRKKANWKPERYNGEYHGHLHISSDVADDGNTDHWDIADAVPTKPSGTPSTVGGRKERNMFFFCGTAQKNPDGNRWAVVLGGRWFEFKTQEDADNLSHALAPADGQARSAEECSIESWQRLKAEFTKVVSA